MLIVNCCHCTEIPKAKVSIKPDQHVFRGETVTLRCDIDGDGATSWKYSWYKDGSVSVFSELQEHTFRFVTESDAGKYFCYGAERGGSRTSNISDAVTLTVSGEKLRLTLRCSDRHPVVGRSAKGYSWYATCRGPSTFHWQLNWLRSARGAMVPRGLVPWRVCRHCYPQTAHATACSNPHFPKPKLTVRPQSSLFTGDSVTLRCEVDQSQDGWEFLWSKNSNTESTEAATKTINSVKVSDGGEYRCRARRGGYFTDYSEPVTVTIYEKPKPTVTIKPDRHAFGDTVTLRCDIYGEGFTSWRYNWYKDGLDNVFSELQEHIFSPVTESDAGKYSCYGTEREGSRNSQLSDAVTLTVSGVFPPVSLIISPSRTQHFTSVSLSLSCKDQGNSDKWRVRRYTNSGQVEDCSSSLWSSKTRGSTCTNSYTSTADTGVYWCQSESGENYHPVNITVHSGVILESPVHPVTEGDTLTLRCLYPYSTPPNLRADFYKDGSLIQNQTTEMIISAVSKSHEGFYYCKHPERGESLKSWISVTVSQISVLHTLSSVLTVCPYLLVTVVLIFKCYRMRGKIAD
uniref:Si:ch211-8c17.2 n=1 Tax=Sinocyclocheilus grahami TaxID=75366 RepID=A0A672NYU9_SINGR